MTGSSSPDGLASPARAATWSTARSTDNAGNPTASRTRSRSTRSLRRSPISARPRARTAQAGTTTTSPTVRGQRRHLRPGRDLPSATSRSPAATTSSRRQPRARAAASRSARTAAPTGRQQHGRDRQRQLQGRQDQAELARQLADLQQRRHDRRRPTARATAGRRLRRQAGRPLREDAGRATYSARDERHRRGHRPQLCLRRPELGGRLLQGTYRFYTIATDVADNAEAPRPARTTPRRRRCRTHRPYFGDRLQRLAVLN